MVQSFPLTPSLPTPIAHPFPPTSGFPADLPSLCTDNPLSFHSTHNARDETTTTMSSYGLSESPPISSHRLSGEWIMQDLSSDLEAVADEQYHTSRWISRHTQTSHDDSYTQHRAPKRVRVQFSGFATVARQRLYQQRRHRQLIQRKCILQQSVALSARLLRASSWVRDGLVEITNHEDTTGFVKVYEHAQNLVDHCYSKWSNDLRSLDDVHAPAYDSSSEPELIPFLRQLPQHSRQDLLQFLSALRSKPQFLLERFRALNVDQVAALWRHPRWQDVSVSVSHARVSNAQRRRHLSAFSRELEDYATSIERSDPLSFLLFNLYATNQALHTREDQLRLSTWSSVCADLLIRDAASYNTLIGQVLIAFATTQDWPAKDRVELFLMDHLQKGAFLLENDNNLADGTTYDPLTTKHACEFFDNAINDLFSIFVDHGGGFPSGALALARAILGKLPRDKEESFRSHVFYNWFLDYFLRITITHPENENMLLKIHISKRARDVLLNRLIGRAIDKIYDHAVSGNEDILWNQCSHIINHLEADTPVSDPYSAISQNAKMEEQDIPAISICAYEVVQVLEALSPLPSHSLRSAGVFWQGVAASYTATYTREANTRFDQVKTDLRTLLEPGVAAKDVHPCSENWLQLEVRPDGNLHELDAVDESYSSNILSGIYGLDNVQQAALRLCSNPSYTESRPTLSDAVCLDELFRGQINLSEAQLRTLDAVYWRQARANLSQKYPLSIVAGDDSAVLTDLTQQVAAVHASSVRSLSALEGYIRYLETSYAALKASLERFTTSLDELRLKLWYVTSVIRGPGYGISRDVTAALNNMNLSRIRMTTTIDSAKPAHRPPSSKSAVSSIFGQSRNDTLDLLKAPTAWGGPRKLDDSQIRYVRDWLKRNDIENFCKGEERIHRFCMEIKNLAKTLTGDNLTVSPELWTSELFVRERTAYEVHGLGPHSAPSTSRPASVRSDPASTTFPNIRSGFRSVDHDNRSTISDDRTSLRRGSIYGIFQDTVASSRQFLPPDLASSIGSYRGGSSVTTASGNSIFSAPYSSITSVSASAHSRPPSIIHEGTLNRVTSSLKQKRKFLHQVQQGLTCLLLSDLGCLVWSWGSETDAWLDKARVSKAVTWKLRKRELVDTLVPSRSTPYDEEMFSLTQHVRRKRSSSDNNIITPSEHALDDLSTLVAASTLEDVGKDINYLTCLDDILLRLSQSIDPIEKLKAVDDFSDMALQQLRAERGRSKFQYPQQSRLMNGSTRRGSLNSREPSAPVRGSGDEARPITEDEVNRHFRKQFMELQPRTLFRDLQYIAAFATPDMLDKSSRGKALWQVGFAAMSYKAEVCRSMVEVADDIVAADFIKRIDADFGHEQSISKAADYWKIGALEGNAAAQRELASLYLMHPEMLPVVSSALYLSADIFKDGMMWQESFGENKNRQALCLALHWMQQARDNGDALARQKLEERDQEHSIQ